MLEQAVSKASANLCIGEAQRVDNVGIVVPTSLNGEVAALIENGQWVAKGLKWQVEGRAGQSDAFHLGHVDGRHLRQHVNESTGGAALKPVAVHLVVVERLEQAEGVVYVGLALAEVVAVVVGLQLGQHRVVALPLASGHQLDVGPQSGDKFLLRDAADGLIDRHHRDIVQVVELREDAHLREFRDASDEDELQVAVLALQRHE